jgi:feruloyl-CoA synthase
MSKNVLPDGSILLKAEEALDPFDPNIVRTFLSRAEQQPDKTIYAQRSIEADGSRGDWIHQSFANAKNDVRAIAQWFINERMAGDDRLLILSGNSIAHAMMRLGAMAAGVTSCPVSANYSLLGGGFERLRHVVDLVQPTVIFAEPGAGFDDALNCIDLGGRVVITRHPESLSVPSVSYASVCATTATSAVEERIEAADPDAHAVYMLTSGSTGMPKAVIQTQRMLGTDLYQAFQALGKAAGWDDVMLDWLPWNHVSGAFNLFAAAVFGGTLYIDDGKPVPGLFEETIRNLREISVPYFCNVPTGFATLVDALETDEVLRRSFFKELRLLLYGGAGLPQPVYDRLQRLAIKETGNRIFMTTGYGATETASGCMAIFFDTDKVGIGLPMPGLELKLVPHDDRYEIRLRGDNVTPGYLDNPEKTAEVFDDEGFYRTGDAARFHDNDDVSKGLAFAGRLAEEFKLGSGTWVSGGQVRANIVEALSPAISDLILCGIGRDSLAVLAVPNFNGLREITGLQDAPTDSLVGNSSITEFLTRKLKAYNEKYPGNSKALTRFSFVRELPSSAKHEISDKGTVNQAIAAENRSDEIDALYSTPAPDSVIVL